jgi:hypothetical protein
MIGGSHLSLVEEREGLPFRDLVGWAVGRLQSWAEMVPVAFSQF